MTELFLLARVAGHGIAIAAAEIESVVDIGVVVPVPRAHPAVCGIAALRSRVVTVIDTWAMLGTAPPAGVEPRAVISRIDGHGYAFLVDGVEDVTTLARERLPNGVALTGAWTQAARGTVVRDGELLLIVTLAALVPGDQSVNPTLTVAAAG